MWTLQDAKNRFSAVVDAAMRGTPQEVSRRGKPAVVVLSVAEHHRLRDDARAGRGSFVDHLLAYRSDEVERSGARPRDVSF